MPKKTYTKGDDFKERGATYKSYGINESGDIVHTNKIEVYGDPKLRNKILKLLQGA